MTISYLGYSCFKIQSNSGTSIIINPFDPKLGLKLPSLSSDIVALSLEKFEYNNLSAVKGSPYIINLPGEYDIKDILVEGIKSKSGNGQGENIIYRLEVDGITICHLGSLGSTLDEKQMDRLNSVEILLLPVGGGSSLNASLATEVMNQIEPRLVIPMNYNLPGLKISGLDDVEKFSKASGLKPRIEEKIKLNKKDLPVEDTELVILSI